MDSQGRARTRRRFCRDWEDFTCQHENQKKQNLSRHKVQQISRGQVGSTVCKEGYKEEWQKGALCKSIALTILQTQISYAKLEGGNLQGFLVWQRILSFKKGGRFCEGFAHHAVTLDCRF